MGDRLGTPGAVGNIFFFFFSLTDSPLIFCFFFLFFSPGSLSSPFSSHVFYRCCFQFFLSSTHELKNTHTFLDMQCVFLWFWDVFFSSSLSLSVALFISSFYLAVCCCFFVVVGLLLLFCVCLLLCCCCCFFFFLGGRRQPSSSLFFKIWWTGRENPTTYLLSVHLPLLQPMPPPPPPPIFSPHILMTVTALMSRSP